LEEELDMHEKEKGLARDFLDGKLSRRELIKRFSALGLTASSAGVLLNMQATNALAADFDWKAHSGKSIKVLLNKHPYADAMIANLDNFKELTGMETSGSSEYDAFMTGAYMTWTYGPAGWIEDLNPWIQDPAKTNPNYNWDDMLEGVSGACLGATSKIILPITLRCSMQPEWQCPLTLMN